MFKDYYAILEVDENVTQEEVKSAFNKQALKWHPDHNQGMDTTKHMQEINEAYLILKDIEARERYDRECQLFKIFQQQKERQAQKRKEPQYQYQQSKQDSKQREYEYADYKVDDDILYKWMNNAKQQAVDLAKQSIEDLKGMVAVGAKAAAKEAGNQFVNQIIISVIILVVFLIVKSCNN